MAEKTTTEETTVEETTTETVTTEEVKAAEETPATDTETTAKKRSPSVKAKLVAAEAAKVAAAQAEANVANPEADIVVTATTEEVNPVNKKPSEVTIQITNRGPRSFEVFTKTDLPAGQTVNVVCRNRGQANAVISKLNQLNVLAKKQRYEFKEV